MVLYLQLNGSLRQPSAVSCKSYRRLFKIKPSKSAQNKASSKDGIITALHVEITHSAPEQAVAPVYSDIEQIIRDAANKYDLDGDRLVAMAQCESNLNPSAVNYNYYENGNPSGLFQHLTIGEYGGYWKDRATNYGWDGASVFNAQANAEVTAQMIRDGLSGLWACAY